MKKKIIILTLVIFYAAYITYWPDHPPVFKYRYPYFFSPPIPSPVYMDEFDNHIFVDTSRKLILIISETTESDCIFMIKSKLNYAVFRSRNNKHEAKYTLDTLELLLIRGENKIFKSIDSVREFDRLLEIIKDGRSNGSNIYKDIQTYLDNRQL